MRNRNLGLVLINIVNNLLEVVLCLFCVYYSLLDEVFVIYRYSRRVFVLYLCSRGFILCGLMWFVR